MAEELATRLADFDQQHVLAHWDRLDEPGRRRLAAQLQQVDLQQLQELFRQATQKARPYTDVAARAGSPPAIRLHEAHRRFPADEAIARGESALRSGRVGAILVAGGQGTRLGFDHPKGMFPIGPVSGATLFQILVEKLLATARRYGQPVPLYLMTSPATHRETIRYFDRQQRFGLAEEDLFIFCQGTMPALDDRTGKLLLVDEDSLALSPDGHGGSVAALKNSGALADMRQRGIQTLYYFQVDNALAPVCEPAFLGYHLLAESEMTTLAVAKQAPGDRVGNIVEVDGRVQVIEYSDLPPAAAERRTPEGELVLWAGNTAIHAFDRDFVARMSESPERLPFHIAHKKVPHLTTDGRRVSPDQPNAYKFEKFIFDLLPEARNPLVIEADPAHAFAPLKNAPAAAADTEQHVHRAMLSLYRRWLEAAGARLADNAAVEISPIFALDAAELAKKIEPGRQFVADTYLR